MIQKANLEIFADTASYRINSFSDGDEPVAFGENFMAGKDPPRTRRSGPQFSKKDPSTEFLFRDNCI